MTAKQLITRIEAVGWYFERMGKGSHRIFKHPDFKEELSIPDHGKRDLGTGLANKLLKQAGAK